MIRADGRIACDVPHCIRSQENKREGCEVDGEWREWNGWICHRHYALVPLRLKRLHREAKRRLRKSKTWRAARLASGLFERCLRTATEIEAGLK